jgi:membrane-bound metal-dependent hydrolase YbcI (DUF457 family)
MPCAATHRIINFTATASYLASRPPEQQQGIAHPIVGGTASALLASLPDAIEPAIHPHHRQFFHGFAFACMVGYGLHRAYQWNPETDGQKLLRVGALVVGSAYLLHLAADLFTARSIPVLGK